MNYSKATCQKEWFKRIPHYAKKKLAKNKIFDNIPILSEFQKEIFLLPQNERYLISKDEFEERKKLENFTGKKDEIVLKFLLKDSPNYNLSHPTNSKVVALDCEMVGCDKNKEKGSMLARVSIIDYHGKTLYDSFVSPTQPVTDYRYWITGIGPNNLENAPSFDKVTSEVKQILSDKFVVGYALPSDFKALGFNSSLFNSYDLSNVHLWLNRKEKMGFSLRKLVFNLIGIKIQTGAHSPIVDALATMAVYRIIIPTIDGSFVFSAPEIEDQEEKV